MSVSHDLLLTLSTVIFAVITYSNSVGAQINSFVPTVVAVFLPLSGMWASAQTTHNKLVHTSDRVHRAIPVGHTDLSSIKAYGNAKSSGTDTADTLIGDYDLEHGHGGVGAHSPSASGSGSGGAADTLEMEQMKSDIVVDRTYSVRSD